MNPPPMAVMRDLQFTGIGPGAAPAAIAEAESRIGRAFPPGLAWFYATVNGGGAEICYFMTDFEHARLHEFRSLSSALRSHAAGVAKGFLPEALFPFAIDEGGNYIALGQDGAVYYYVHDTWEEDLPVAENQANATTRIGDSFEDFIDRLVTQEEAEAIDFGE